jgi:hypothetical protein
MAKIELGDNVIFVKYAAACLFGEISRISMQKRAYGSLSGIVITKITKYQLFRTFIPIPKF